MYICKTVQVSSCHFLIALSQHFMTPNSQSTTVLFSIVGYIQTKSLQSCWTLMTLQTVARQAALSMGFSRPDYWGGLPYPPPGDLRDPGGRTHASDVSYIGRQILHYQRHLGIPFLSLYLHFLKFYMNGLIQYVVFSFLATFTQQNYFEIHPYYCILYYC